MYNYVVNAQKPTAVTHTLKGNFTGSDDLNLIICKSTHIELHLLTPDGLEPRADLNIYGRISTAQLYRPQGESKDLLFILTESWKFFVLSYDTETNEVKTKASGDVSEKTGKPCEDGMIGIIDPECRCIGLHLYTGFLLVIPMDARGTWKEAFNIRLEELQVLDIKFLHGQAKPTIAILYEDMKENRHIKTYEVMLKNKDLADGPWSQSNVDSGTERLVPIPQPYGGILVLGTESIAYIGGLGQTEHIAIPIRCGIICTVGKIDNNGLRWLLGDSFGGLHVLALQTQAKNTQGTESHASSSSTSVSRVATNISMDYLGETSIASGIQYLDNGVVFIGSAYGDSQLINLLEERDEETNSSIEVLESYTNLGPIIDFCVMDLDRQGQGQVVTCSGVLKNGSLRVVRNGIGIDEQASVDLPGIKGIWSLRKNFDSEWDNYLVQSFVGETRVLAIQDSEMEEFDIPGFSSDCETLFCNNMVGNVIVQVTYEKINVIMNGEICDTWKPESSDRITVATGNASQLLVAFGGGKIIYLELEDGKLMEKGNTTLEHEIACMNAHPLNKNSQDMEIDNESANKKTSHVAIGMWEDFSVRILTLPNLQQIHKENVGVDTIPRSLQFCDFQNGPHLLCGLGDGHLFTYAFNLETGTLSDRKKSSLGSKPINLSLFKNGNANHVFAASDRPAVIYSSGDKLLFSNVNLREVTLMTPFNSESFPECLALTTEEELKIGTINEIQKLHVRTIPLGEQPRRIAHHASSKAIAVSTVRYSALPNQEFSGNLSDEFSEVCSLRLFDDQTFEPMDSYQFDECEMVTSMLTCRFAQDSGDDSPMATEQPNDTAGTQVSVQPPKVPNTITYTNKEYLIVGTAYVLPEEDEPKKGRLLVFEVIQSVGSESLGTGDRKLNLVLDKPTRGAVHSMDGFQGKLITGINSKIQLYKFVEKDGTAELQTECGHHGQIMALLVRSHGDFIVTGDMMKSISLLMYKSLDGSIEEVARDCNPNSMSAIEILNEDTYIGAEAFANLFMVQRNSGATTDEERCRLDVVGEYHLGDYVNCFRKGSLVMRTTPEVPNASVSDLSGETNMMVEGSGNNSSVYPTPFTTSTAIPKLLYGTIDGMIGVVATLTQPQYKFLKRFEKAMNTVVKGIGGLEHSEFRSFYSERKTSPSHGFIDGDLIESFLDLKQEDMERVTKSFNDGITELEKNPECKGEQQIASSSDDTKNMQPLEMKELVKLVEELSRLH